MVSGVLQSITSLSAAAGLIARGLHVDLDGIGSLRIPGRVVNPTLAGTWIAEGLAIPIRALTLFAGPTLTPKKVACIATFTGEQAKSSNIEAFVRAALSEMLALALDLKMFSSDAATAAAPAGILNGVTPLTATPVTGNAPSSAAVADIGNLVKALAANGGGLNPVLIGSAAQAMTLKVFAADWDAPVLASATIPDKTLIAVEAESFVSGFGAMPTFDMAEAAVVHEEDTSPGAVVASSPLRSLWQTDCVGLKATLKGSWAMRVPGHVAFVSATNW
jgi:hypothetical protein